MAVVPCSSDVLCTHETRLQLLYMDVQQLKMVQMVSQPIYSAICIYLSDVITLLIKIKGLSKNFSFWTVSLDLDATALIIFGAVALLHTSYVHAF